MLEKMVKDILEKLMRTVYIWLRRPAVLYARIVAAQQDAAVVGPMVELQMEDGNTLSGYLQEQWWSYTIRILDRDGADDPKYSPIPDVRSKLRLFPGAKAAVVMPYGDLLPVIVAEVMI